jgi:hypothetical protein
MAVAHLTCARSHCLAPRRAVDAPLESHAYGRLFPGLKPLVTDEAALWALGEQGGACDGSVFADVEGGDDARETAAGWPFFGQFVAHDITADRSLPAHQADAAALRNARNPTIDLECLYGDGPSGAPYLYDRDDPAKLLLGINDAGQADDLPRNSQGMALIGDPRNDVHLFVAQFHVAMIKFHNRLVDWLREQGVPEAAVFGEAQRLARWHYQWIVLHEFLPRLVGQELMTDVLKHGPRFFRPQGVLAIPLEFADAAYRYGHSQIRHRYRINNDTPLLPLFPDLVGFDHVPASRVIDWSLLFDLPGHAPAQRAKKIDGRLARSLIELPLAITGEVEVDAYHSLAVRDLQRGHGLGLPSGEAVSAALGVAPLTAAEVGLGEGWRDGTPLWFYFLKEAEVRTDGERLGPAGGRIVGEVFIAMLDRDPGSFRTADPGWAPTLPAAESGTFGMADLLLFAAGSR